jgi:pimeloyl-ACP methyl ester carboxylesterase
MTSYHKININGVNVFYRAAGAEDLPVLLLLHGFPASSFMFRDLIDRLSDRFRVIAPDYPGFGYSDAPSTREFEYTFDSLANVLEHFIEALNIQRYALYMQDFGGPVGFRLATRHPGKISFLIVQNANAYEEGLPESFWALARQLWKDPSEDNFTKLREAGMSREAVEWNYTHGAKDITKVSPDSSFLQTALLEREGNKEAMLELLYDYRTNLALYPEWHSYFRRSQPPTLIVWGKNDVIFPASGAYPYRRDLNKVDFNLLDAGHFALEEQGQEIAAHIKRFAQEISSVLAFQVTA